MDHFRAVQLVAAWDVLRPEPTVEYFLRRVMRWYSEKFSTELAAVEDIPLDDLLQHWYECEFESMKDGDPQARQQLEEYVLKIAQSDNERAAEEAEEQAFEDATGAEIDAREAREAEEARQRALAKPDPRPEDDEPVFDLDFSSLIEPPVRT